MPGRDKAPVRDRGRLIVYRAQLALRHTGRIPDASRDRAATPDPQGVRLAVETSRLARCEEPFRPTAFFDCRGPS